MRVGIVGGGFAGLAAAIAFRQRGHRVVVFEKATGPSPAGGAISLAPNALACLEALGVRTHIATQPWSRMPATVRTSSGRVLVRRTLAQLTGGEYAAVPRGQLIGLLAAALPAEVVRYGQAVTVVSVDGTVSTNSGGEHFDLVVAADGANGVTRKALWPRASPLRATGITGWAWIVDRHLTAGFGAIWGRTADFGILPLVDGRTYIYGGTAIPDTELSEFHSWPEPLPELIHARRPDQTITPTIYEARPPRRLAHGKVVLIGDAAHTMRPTFGQGAALAMEDAITLAAGGTAALTHRYARTLALYSISKAGSYVSAPRLAPLEWLRNGTLRALPDPVFGAIAGTPNRWFPPR
jgi:2-polyprenyl-6-methoxyphenol hydroxylase-like FAD-dependent oxidoreductase